MTLLEQFKERFPLYVSCLMRARRHGRFAHSFLVQGESAEVREKFAALIAQIACCPNSMEGAPCGVCHVCKGLESGSSPDLHVVTPSGKAFQIQVGDHDNPEPNTVRDFERKFHLTSANSKVGFIHDADRMNDAAQNSLLKTLEEPPGNTIFVLTTARPGLLLATTRSRCQKIALIENRCDVRFGGHEEVRSALELLYREGAQNLLTAEVVAARLGAVASGLRRDAEERVDEMWHERIKRASEYDSALGKRMEKQRDAAAAGEYLRERSAFLSYIQNFCGELYLLGCGANRDDLAVPELLENISDDEIASDRAEALQQASGMLLYNSKFNVNEELALRVFAYRAAFPGGTQEFAS